jgi:hypothetical protein
MRRFDLVDTAFGGEAWREMVPNDTGEWVRFEDVEALVAQSMTSDRYLAEIQEHRRLYGRAEADRDAAVARAERAEEQRDRARAWAAKHHGALCRDGGPCNCERLTALADDPPAARVVCAWCGAVLSDGAEPVSHGICPGCEERYKGEEP